MERARGRDNRHLVPDCVPIFDRKSGVATIERRCGRRASVEVDLAEKLSRLRKRAASTGAFKRTVRAARI
jgi:hypothetical protein